MWAAQRGARPAWEHLQAASAATNAPSRVLVDSLQVFLAEGPFSLKFRM